MTASMEEVLDFMEPWKNFKQRCEAFLHANQTTILVDIDLVLQVSTQASPTLVYDRGLQVTIQYHLGNARDSIYFC